MFAIEARDFTRRLAINSALLQIGTLVMRKLARAYADFGFRLPVFPIHFPTTRVRPFHLRFSVESVDLLAVDQQFAYAFCGRNFVAGALVGLNVGILKERFAVLDSRERVTDVGLARADRFDFAALQLDARFVTVNDVIITQRFAIDDGFSCHVATDPDFVTGLRFVVASAVLSGNPVTSIETSSKIVGRPLRRTPEPNPKQCPELLRAVRGTFERLVSQFAGDDFL